MFHLQSISLTHFKNYDHRSFQFNERITAICGNNGTGKTSLLDAIHYLCFTKSYFTRDANNVKEGQAGFRLEGKFVLQDKKEKAVCILRETGKKEFTVNETLYEKFSHHIGHYPCVIIAPDDAQLITGDSKIRRNFLDSLLSQVYPDYLQNLIVYTKLLQQRNSLLKSFAETGNRDFSLLDVIDEQMEKPCDQLFNKRREFLISFLPIAKRLYHDIAQQAEDITLLYESELLQSGFLELLKATRQKDCFAQRTTSGIHRDDLVISFGKKLFRNVASQGQQKSLLFALKLAELEVLKKDKGFAPLLLLDDVFEKLDEDRIANLLRKVCIENDGQVFITDTNKERVKEHLELIQAKYELIQL